MKRLAVFAVAVALCAGMSALRADEAALQPCADAAAMQRWVERLNLQRGRTAPCSAGAADAALLRWEPRLAASALAQALDLARRDTLSHQDVEHRSFAQRVRAVGYPLRSAGENLAAGRQEFEGTLDDWLASDAHCRTLMQPGYSDVGLACIERPGTRFQRFWVAHLGTPARR